MRVKKEYLFLAILLLAAGVIRLFEWEKSFLWGHDHDLYSWIAKDILVNQHQRLVGQITSVDGVFIGSLYYYLMALGYWFSGMDAWGAVIITTVVGLLSVVSVWWVFRTTISPRAGWMAAVFWTVSWGIASYEKWSVPTQPVLLWTIWYWWAAVRMTENKLRGWLVYATLVGLVWQIHIGLLPLLPVPLVVTLAKNIWSKSLAVKVKLVALVVGWGLVVNLPLALFEIKTNFSQTKAMWSATKIDKGGPSGWQKIEKVMEASGKEIQMRLFAGWESEYWKYWVLPWLASLALLAKSKKIKSEYVAILIMSVTLVGLAQFSSKRVVSEYYFTALAVMVLIGLIRLVDKLDRRIVILLLLVFGISNFKTMINNFDVTDSLYYRRQVVEYIKQDMDKRGFECMAINFITTPGNNVGFRYLLWHEGVRQVKAAASYFPIYNISNPWLITEDENDKIFGRFGVIRPQDEGGYNFDKCQKPEYEPDPLLGYVD